MLPTWCPDGACTRMAQSDAHTAPECGNLGTVCGGGRTHSWARPVDVLTRTYSQGHALGLLGLQPLPGAQGAPPVSLQRVLGTRTHRQGEPRPGGRGQTPHARTRNGDKSPSSGRGLA